MLMGSASTNYISHYKAKTTGKMLTYAWKIFMLVSKIAQIVGTRDSLPTLFKKSSVNNLSKQT